MPVIYADSSDGHISANGSSWTAAREATTGSLDSTATQVAYAVRAASLNNRGGGLTYRWARTFLAFDVSSISNATSVSLKLRGHGSGGAGGGVCVMRATAFGNSGTTALAAGDYDAIHGWNGTSAMPSSSLYSAAPAINPATWTTSGYNSLPLSGSAEVAINNNNYLLVCIVDYTYDYLGAQPYDNSGLGTGALANRVGLYFTDTSGVNYDPYLDITVQGYGHNLNSVSAANIGKVNIVATADIAKINTL